MLSVFILFSINNFDSFGNSNKNIQELENNVIKMIDESNFEKAISYLDQILEIEPNNTNALNNKGGALIKSGNYSESIKYFDSVLSLNQNNTEALNNKAIALYNQELYVQSLRTFYKSLETDPSNVNTINNTKKLVDQLYWIDETEKGYGVISIFDKNGNLIGNSKISEIKIQPPLGYIYLEKGGIVKEIDIDGETKKIIEYTGNISLDRTQYVGRADLFFKFGDYQIKVVELVLNGFIATIEDKIEYKIVIFESIF